MSAALVRAAMRARSFSARAAYRCRRNGSVSAPRSATPALRGDFQPRHRRPGRLAIMLAIAVLYVLLQRFMSSVGCDNRQQNAAVKVKCRASGTEGV